MLTEMAKHKERTVYRDGRSGQWVNKRNDSTRIASSHSTQQEAIDAARRMLRQSGGGELTVRGHDGLIRSKDTLTTERSSKVLKENADTFSHVLKRLAKR